MCAIWNDNFYTRYMFGMRFGFWRRESTEQEIKNCLEATGPDINLVAIQEQRAQTEVLGANAVHFLRNSRARTSYLSSTQHYAEPLPPGCIDRTAIPTDTKFISTKCHLQPATASIIFVLN